MKAGILLIFSFGLLHVCEAQSVKRQSIGSLGITHHAEGLIVQQSIGQTYITRPYYHGVSEVLPGFIQPSAYYATTYVRSMRLDVFPNPTAETVSFLLKENLEHVMLDVYDQTGRLVHKEEIEDLSAYRLDCSQWSDGAYMLIVKEKSGRIYRSKLIKSK